MNKLSSLPDAGDRPEPCDVLIVDDDPTQAEELASYLRRHRMTVRSVHSGSEAAHRVGQLDPGVAILDYNLPDLDGVTVAERIRRLSPRTAILVISGRIAGLSESTLRTRGIHSFMHKPVDPRSLRRSVAALVKNGGRAALPAPAPRKWLGLSFG